MKGTEFLTDLSAIDEELIAEAEAGLTEKKKKTSWGKWAAMAACLCALAVGGAFLIRNAGKAPVTSGEDGPAPESTAADTTATTTAAADIPVIRIIGTEDEGLSNWNGKEIPMGLAEALDGAAATDVFAITARPAMDKEFVYQGKTLWDYYLAKGEEADLPEKCMELLKEGESLKYGEALYQTGTPEGEVWYEDLYRERVAFYGEDLLAKYIVDGEFLKEKLEGDLSAAAVATEARDAYNEANGAYLRSLAADLPGTLPAEVSEDGEYLILYMTRDQFAAFTPEEWIFLTLPQNGGLYCEDE